MLVLPEVTTDPYVLHTLLLIQNSIISNNCLQSTNTKPLTPTQLVQKKGLFPKVTT